MVRCVQSAFFLRPVKGHGPLEEPSWVRVVHNLSVVASEALLTGLNLKKALKEGGGNPGRLQKRLYRNFTKQKSPSAAITYSDG